MHPALLVALVVWFLVELVMVLAKRAGGTGDRSRDAGTLALLWIVIPISCAAAGLLAGFGILPFPVSARMPLMWVGIVLIVLGLALRLLAILTLERMFTVDVAIREGHRLVTSGPYRFVRHPSYAGSLLSFLGFGLALGTFPALLVATLPAAGVFAARIRVEERALARAFGEAWRHYAERTARLVPGLY